jgi:RecB family exonuclease
MNTSHSALENFRSCPLRYKYENIEKLKVPKTPEAIFGSLIHSTMKLIHDSGMLPPTQQEALAFFTTNWKSDSYKNEVEERMAFAQGIRIIQDYYKKNDISAAQILDLESRFSIQLEDKNETHLISGFIDRIDKTEDGFEIIDYKTARKLPPQEKVDENMQLLIYLMAFVKRYPQFENELEKVKLSLYFLKHGVKLTTFKNQEQLEQAKERVLETIHEIQKSDFKPNPTPLCDWCGFQKICPMWKHKFKNEVLPNEEEQNKLIKEYVELQKMLKQARARLAELTKAMVHIMEVQQADRLFNGGYIVSKKQQTTYAYDETALKELLSAQQLWDNVVNINQTKLNKVLATLPLETKETIEKLKTVKKQSWSVSIKAEKGAGLEDLEDEESQQ